MYNPLISVIIPCYNQAHYLSDAINSILSQTYNTWECIIIDDGSSDNTKYIASQFVNLDRRIKYLYQNNKGLAASRNLGLKMATGEFIQFLDADDKIASDKFQTQINIFAQNKNVDIVYSEYRAFTDDDPENLYSYHKRLYINHDNPLDDFIYNYETEFITPVHIYMFRKSCFDNWGKYDETLKNYEDWDLYIRFAINNPVYSFHPDIMAFYRRNTGGICANPDKTLSWKKTVIKKHLKNNLLNNSHKKHLIFILHNSYGQSAFSDLHKKNIFKGLKKLFWAAVFSKNPLYYIYHGTYWLLKK